jgi:uncharacterized protein YxjI
MEVTPMQFPLKLTFKILAVAPQITVTDASGQTLFYVKQKLFKLKEAITVFSDSSQTKELYKINADRVIDFSAKYHLMDVNGQEIGSIKREGVRSIFKARYDIFDSNGSHVLDINEESAFVRVMDALFGEIPVLGMFTGYVFNPTYIVADMQGQIVMKIKKEPAFLETGFVITQERPMPDDETLRAVLGAFMMVLLERIRG